MKSWFRVKRRTRPLIKLRVNRHTTPCTIAPADPWSHSVNGRCQMRAMNGDKRCHGPMSVGKDCTLTDYLSLSLIGIARIFAAKVHWPDVILH